MISKDASLSAKKMAILLNKSDRTVQRLLSKLKEKGALERIGSTKGYWKRNNCLFSKNRFDLFLVQLEEISTALPKI